MTNGEPEEDFSKILAYFNLDHGTEKIRDIYSQGTASDFNSWNMFGTPMLKVKGGGTCKLNLEPGRYLYKYIIDRDWAADSKTPHDKLLKDGQGHGGLTELIVE